MLGIQTTHMAPYGGRTLAAVTLRNDAPSTRSHRQLFPMLALSNQSKTCICSSTHVRDAAITCALPGASSRLRCSVTLNMNALGKTLTIIAATPNDATRAPWQHARRAGALLRTSRGICCLAYNSLSARAAQHSAHSAWRDANIVALAARSRQRLFLRSRAYRARLRA